MYTNLFSAREPTLGFLLTLILFQQRVDVPTYIRKISFSIFIAHISKIRVNI